MSCYICENLEAGDTLYASSDWDGGLGFDYIRDIQYCPVCGRKLAEQTEPKNCDNCGTPRHLCKYCIKEDRMWTPQTEPKGRRGEMMSQAEFDEMVHRVVVGQTEPTTEDCSTDEQTELQKTADYCDTCNHKGCENCVGNNSNPYCVPSRYEPKDEPQTEDLQDWKDRMWAEAIVIEPITEDCSMISCLKCEHNEQCHYLVKDIPWPDCPWKRRYEYNRLCSIING